MLGALLRPIHPSLFQHNPSSNPQPRPASSRTRTAADAAAAAAAAASADDTAEAAAAAAATAAAAAAHIIDTAPPFPAPAHTPDIPHQPIYRPIPTPTPTNTSHESASPEPADTSANELPAEMARSTSDHTTGFHHYDQTASVARQYAGRGSGLDPIFQPTADPGGLPPLDPVFEPPVDPPAVDEQGGMAFRLRLGRGLDLDPISQPTVEPPAAFVRGVMNTELMTNPVLRKALVHLRSDLRSVGDRLGLEDLGKKYAEARERGMMGKRRKRWVMDLSIAREQETELMRTPHTTLTKLSVNFLRLCRVLVAIWAVSASCFVGGVSRF